MLPIVIEYEQTLMGNKLKVSPSFFKGAPELAHENALQLFRYAFCELLNWEPEEIQRNVTREILKKLKLDVIYDKYIIYPIELDKDDDIHYLAYLMFPNKIYYPTKDLALAVLKRVDEKGKKFPKFYFSSEGGMERACFSLLYMINSHMWNRSIEEYYSFFADKQEAEKFLKKHHLLIAYNSHFGSALDYFHYSLSNEQQDEFYYYFHKFNEYWDKLNFTKNELVPIKKNRYFVKDTVNGICVYRFKLKDTDEEKVLPQKDVDLRMCFDDEEPFLNDFEYNTNHKYVLYVPESDFDDE